MWPNRRGREEKFHTMPMKGQYESKKELPTENQNNSKYKQKFHTMTKKFGTPTENLTVSKEVIHYTWSWPKSKLSSLGLISPSMRSGRPAWRRRREVGRGT